MAQNDVHEGRAGVVAGWDSTNSVARPVAVDSNGNLKVTLS